MTTDAQPAPADKSPDVSRSNRRWYQFSLRVLFVWVTVVGVLLGMGMRWIAPAQRQRAAVQMVERRGGRVEYFASPADEGWLTTYLRQWLPRDYFDALRRISLSDSTVTDADLQSLRGLTQLQQLSLYNAQVSDAGIIHLSGLTQLQHLSLYNTQVSDAGLTHLSGLQHLQWLTLTAHITDAGLARLSGLK